MQLHHSPSTTRLQLGISRLDSIPEDREVEFVRIPRDFFVLNHPCVHLVGFAVSLIYLVSVHSVPLFPFVPLGMHFDWILVPIRCPGSHHMLLLAQLGSTLVTMELFTYCEFSFSLSWITTAMNANEMLARKKHANRWKSYSIFFFCIS